MTEEDNHPEAGNPDSDKLLVKTSAGHFVKILQSDILHLRADGDYTTIVTAKEDYFKTIRIGKLHKKLDNKRFLRFHKSYVINIDKVTGVHDNHVLISGTEIPIGRTYKPAFDSHFQRI